jgi:hypothetical protein
MPGRPPQFRPATRMHPRRVLLHLVPLLLVEPGRAPVTLMQAHRWIVDPRDAYTVQRKENLQNALSLHKCPLSVPFHALPVRCLYLIGARTYPKGLNTAEAIAKSELPYRMGAVTKRGVCMHHPSRAVKLAIASV